MRDLLTFRHDSASENAISPASLIGKALRDDYSKLFA